MRSGTSAMLEDCLSETAHGATRSFFRNWHEIANDNIMAAGHRISHGKMRLDAQHLIEKVLPQFIDEFIYKKILVIDLGETASLYALRNGRRVTTAVDDPLPLPGDVTARTLCGMIAFLGGMDVLVFTGDEPDKRSAAMRSAVCRQLDWMQIKINDGANVAGAVDISSPESAVQVLAFRPPPQVRK